MKTLLEFFSAYCSFLYLDPRYRITDSRTSGAPTIDAGLTLTGPVLSWSLVNNRGQVSFGVGPTKLASSPDNWFRGSIVRQYLDHFDETNPVSAVASAAWLRANLSRIEELFSENSAASTYAEMIELEETVASKYFGPQQADSE